VGIFSKNRNTGSAGSASVVPASELVRLGQVGRSVYAEGGFVDVSGFYLGSFQKLGLPTGQFAEQLVADLAAGAASAPDEWAYAGALYVAVDFDGPNVATRPGGDALIDQALKVLADRGVSGDRIPMFLMSRWSEINTRRA
jgi:hypothetical protein